MRARARRTDPITSVEAADHAERNSAPHQREICLMAVRMYPGQTAAEIANLAGLNRYAASRRLPELRDAGFIHNGLPRECSVVGSRTLTWLPGSRPDQSEIDFS